MTQATISGTLSNPAGVNKNADLMKKQIGMSGETLEASAAPGQSVSFSQTIPYAAPPWRIKLKCDPGATASGTGSLDNSTGTTAYSVQVRRGGGDGTVLQNIVNADAGQTVPFSFSLDNDGEWLTVVEAG